MGHNKVHSSIDSFYEPYEEEVDAPGPIFKTLAHPMEADPLVGKRKLSHTHPVPIHPYLIVLALMGGCSLHKGLSPLSPLHLSCYKERRLLLCQLLPFRPHLCVVILPASP